MHCIVHMYTDTILVFWSRVREGRGGRGVGACTSSSLHTSRHHLTVEAAQRVLLASQSPLTTERLLLVLAVGLLARICKLVASSFCTKVPKELFLKTELFVSTD